MPPKAVAKKPVAKPKAKADAKKSGAKKSDKAPIAKRSDRLTTDEVKAVVILLFTKCDGQVSLLIGEENYNKWGAPTGSLNLGEKPEDAAKRIFANELGKPMPNVVMHHMTRHNNAMVYMAYSDDCVKDFGSKVASPPELLELKLIPIKSIYSFIEKPNLDKPLRAIFISMMVDCKKDVNAFIDKIK
jgi:hypothetical protein